MAEPRGAFYERVLGGLLDDGLIRHDMSVLVAAGGNADREVLLELGFADVTISNLDEREAGAGLEPYAWRYEDAESLSLEDGSFDVALVSAGLHHCRSPHRALLELYRVARRGLLAIESRDSLLMRLAVRAGAAGEYELEAVAAHGFAGGGVRNSPVPNYVYRWNEREIEKTIASNAPYATHRYRYFREFELPETLLEMRRNRLAATAIRAAAPVVAAIARAFPSQGNLFAFAVLKPELPADLHPWLRLDGEEVVPNADWMRKRIRA
jgi:ubiquinone/menaquinone biosynthesis C-methylase UbiE